MSKRFNISIPKPCHEGWSKMTPNQKGRFCNSCAKTVVDFTKKTIPEIQKYLIENKENGVCGHFYKKQLDTITLEIPNEIFASQLSFQRLFLLALLLTMGTTLMSCNYNDGKKQKIGNVILIDSIEKVEEKIDSIITISKDSLKTEKKIQIPPKPTLTGITISTATQEKEQDSIITIEGEMLEGDVVIEEYNINPNFSFYRVDYPPRFKGSKKLSKQRAKKEFNKKLNEFVLENFNYTSQVNLGLSSGKKKIFMKLLIDENGSLSVTDVRAPHKVIEIEVRKMMQKIPQLFPAKHEGKPVKMEYILPIAFDVE